MDRALDDLMLERGCDYSAGTGDLNVLATAVHSGKARQLLQQAAAPTDGAAWPLEELAALRHAFAAAASFTQAQHTERCYPS